MRPTESCRVAGILVQTDARGVPTHGVTLLPRLTAALRSGELQRRPRLRVLARRGAAVHLDGDNGPGYLVAWLAMERAIRMAERTGVAFVAVSNTNHFGAASVYADQAAEAGVWGLALSNSRAYVAPEGASNALLGTSPVSLAAIGDGGDRLTVDFSTAAIARGKIRRAAREGVPLEPNLALDTRGRPTTDAASAMDGFLLPMGGGRGIALGLLVELLVGLGGARLSLEVPGPDARWGGLGLGQLFVAIDPAAFGAPDQTAARVSRLVQATRERAGRVPGERARRGERTAASAGIAVPDAVRADLVALGEALGVPAPFFSPDQRRS